MYKAIKGYEGIYEVNELGQVRSVNRIVETKDGGIRKYDGTELKPAMAKDGYSKVILNKNGISKMMTVHRLVAETFLPNPDNLPEVHHKNHDRRDNRVENLAWVTRDEQRDDHWKAAIAAQAKTNGVRLGVRLRVVGHGIEKIYNSASEVKRELGIDRKSEMKVAKGEFKQSKGYRIYFADQETETNNA